MNIEHKRIALDKITPDKNQPRKYLVSDYDNELTENIKIHGIINPIEVEKVGSEYRIITGELRWRAAKKAKMGSIDCHVINGLSESERFLRQFSENVQRKDMTPNQITDGLIKIGEKLSHDDVAIRKGELPVTNIAMVVNKPVHWVNTYLKFRHLPEKIKKELKNASVDVHVSAAYIQNAEEDERIKKGTLEKFVTKVKDEELDSHVARYVAQAIQSNPGMADRFIAAKIKGLSRDDAHQKLDKIAPSIRTQALSYEFKAQKINKLANELRERLEQWPSKDFGRQLPLIRSTLRALASKVEKW